MAVLTEITNEDKDLLLSGDCTIPTRLLVFNGGIDYGPIDYDVEYDSANKKYTVYGKSTQETRSGKNLLKNIATTKTNNGINFTVNNDKTILADGTNDGTANSSLVINSYSLKAGTYILNGCPSGGSSTTYRLGIQSTSDWNVLGLDTGSGSEQFTIDEATNVQVAIFIQKGQTISNLLFKPMIRLSSIIDDTYEPYGVMPSPDYPSPISSITGTVRTISQENNKLITVNLQSNELCSLPNNVKDELVIENGRAKIIKNVGKYNITGNEAWSLSGTESQPYINFSNYVDNCKYPTTSTELPNLLSNYYLQITRNNLYDGRITLSPSGALIIYDTVHNTSLANFKEWLKSAGVVVYYQLATPTEIDLPNYKEENVMLLTEKNSVKTWKIDTERYVPDNGFIGQFVAKEVSGTFQNITDDFNIENKQVQIQFGVSKLNSTVTNWYSQGTFIISKPTDDEVVDNTKYSGYDLAILFNIDFDADFTNEDFPKSFNQILKDESSTTNGWLAKYTCAQVGIELATPTFINSDFSILSNQFTSGETCRDVMKYISELAYGYCETYWDDKCYIRNLGSDYTSFDKYHKLDYDQYYNLETQKNIYGPINRVFCGLQDVQGQGATQIDETTIDSGETTINIYNNPLTMGTSLEISEQLQLKAVNKANTLWGIKYRPITSMKTIGHPWLKPYEPIEVSDMENNKIITYPFTNSLEYTGHIKSDISSEGETKTESTYGYKDTIERRMNRIGINVDRANKEITIINQEITKIDDDIKDIRGNMITIGDVYTKSEIRDIVSGVGVDGTVVTSLETATTIFDINGMTIGRTDAQTKTNVNANGMIITDTTNDTELLKINNKGVHSENLTARTYLNFATHGRFEKYKELNQYRIGCFWIEGDE